MRNKRTGESNELCNWEVQRWDAIDRAEIEAWTAALETWRCGGGECVRNVMVRVASLASGPRTRLILAAGGAGDAAMAL